MGDFGHGFYFGFSSTAVDTGARKCDAVLKIGDFACDLECCGGVQQNCVAVTTGRAVK